MVETRDDPDYSKTAEDEDVIACMKDLKTWVANLAAIEKVYFVILHQEGIWVDVFLRNFVELAE